MRALQGKKRSWRKWGLGFTVICLGLLWVPAGPGQSLLSFARPGQIRAWEKVLGWQQSGGKRSDEPSRRLSAGEAAVGKCLKDRLTPEAIRAELARVEAGNARQTVSFRGLGFDLPGPQARFLQAQGGKWHYQGASVDFSGCADAPCIVNRIYGKPDGSPEGLKLYGWYLKMGSVLSSTHEISDVTPESTTPRDPREFHFSDAELTAFWKLTYALPASYRSVATLFVLHRIPRGEIISDWLDSSCSGHPGNDHLMLEADANRVLASCPGHSRYEQVGTCADASYSYGGSTGLFGAIRLNDRCVSLPRTESNFEGFFYLGVPHEMSHHIDFSSGLNRQIGRSVSPEWKALSGWTVEETRDPDTNRLIERRWNSDPNLDGFVRDYAGTTPAEDFADTAAYYRFGSDRAWEKSPRKSAYLQREIFGGRKYDQAGLLATYRALAGESVRARVSALVDSCVVAREGDASGVPAEVLNAVSVEFPAAVPGGIASCLRSRFASEIASALDGVRSTEWEACGLLMGPVVPTVVSQVVTDVTPALLASVSQQQLVAEMIRASRELRQALQDEVDPREAVIRCSAQSEPRTCFDQAIAQRFDAVVEPFSARLGGTVETERQVFRDAHRFDEAAGEVLAFYRQVFSGFERNLERETRELTERCGRELGADSGALVLTPFSGGTHYVSGAILSCLNGGAEEALRKTQTASLSRYGLSLSDDGAKAFVRERLLLPELLSRLQAWVDHESAQEDQIRASRRGAGVQVLRSRLTAQLDWVGTIQQRTQLEERCTERASILFEEYGRELDPGSALPSRFQAPEDIKKDWVTESCRGIAETPALQARLTTLLAAERAEQARLWAAAVADLKGRVLAQLRERGSSCAQRYRNRTSDARAMRARCLRTEWDPAFATAMTAWLADGAQGAPFASRQSEASRLVATDKEAMLRSAALALER